MGDILPEVLLHGGSMAALLRVRIPTQDSLACSKENKRGVVQRPRAPVSQRVCAFHAQITSLEGFP